MQLQYVYVYIHCITQELMLRAQRRLRNSLLYCQIKTKSKVLPEVSRMGPKEPANKIIGTIVTGGFYQTNQGAALEGHCITA